MQRYGIATILEDCPVGYEFTGKDIPLHLTHVDSFVIESDINDAVAKLQKELSDFPSFEVSPLKDEIYGQDEGKEIPVTTLELNPPLKNLHELIMKLLDEEKAFLKNPHFHNAGFRPHVSIYDSRRIAVDEPVSIKDVSIASKLSEGEDAKYRILAVIALK